MAKAYVAYKHNISRALSPVRYPITKEELIKQVGDLKIQKDWDVFITFSDLLKDLPKDNFSCAAELYNNIWCAMW